MPKHRLADSERPRRSDYRQTRLTYISKSKLNKTKQMYANYYFN